MGAVVLAGGASKRMGSDKAALAWNGESMLGRVTRVVAERCDPVLVVASAKSPAYLGLGEEHPGTEQIRWVTDEKPGAGPLAGLARGLAAAAEAGRDVVFVCATDMPLVSVEMIESCCGACRMPMTPRSRLIRSGHIRWPGSTAPGWPERLPTWSRPGNAGCSPPSTRCVPTG